MVQLISSCSTEYVVPKGNVGVDVTQKEIQTV